MPADSSRLDVDSILIQGCVPAESSRHDVDSMLIQRCVPARYIKRDNDNDDYSSSKQAYWILANLGGILHTISGISVYIIYTSTRLRPPLW